MPSRMLERFLRTSALVAVAAVLANGCAKPAPNRQMRVPVVVAKVERRDVPDVLPATGTVEPVQSADVGSQVGGVVTRIEFVEGAEVRAGQALIQLDPRPFRAALAQAAGALARDRAQARTARLAADRAETLFRQSLVSQADHDAALAAAEALAGTVAADSGAVATAKLNLEYATIRSPIAGRTGRRNVNVGDLVKAATSEPLVTVNQVRPIRVRFAVAEDDRQAVQRRHDGETQVIVHGDGPDSTDIVGRLAFVDNAVDPATGTLTLKGEFPNADGRLWPGEFVEVRLVFAMRKGALVVPATAVNSGQQGTYVYVMNADSSATMRPVKVATSDDVTAIIASGLEPGETVVTDGQFRISPASKLVPRDADAGGKGGRRGKGAAQAKPEGRPQP